MQDFTNTKAVMVRNSHLITHYLQASLLIQSVIQKNCSERPFTALIFAGCFFFLGPRITAAKRTWQEYPPLVKGKKKQNKCPSNLHALSCPAGEGKKTEKNKIQKLAYILCKAFTAWKSRGNCSSSLIRRAPR